MPRYIVVEWTMAVPPGYSCRSRESFPRTCHPFIASAFARPWRTLHSPGSFTGIAGTGMSWSIARTHVKLINFGLAFASCGQSHHVHQPLARELQTGSYAFAEEIRGRCDARSDVYSSANLFEMLTASCHWPRRLFREYQRAVG